MSSPTQVDPRGLRVVAGITAAVLAVVLVAPTGVGPVNLSTALLAVQVGVFAIAALVGLQHSPYAQLFARVVRPRIGPPAEMEDSRPPRFAQVVGLVFTAGGLVALLVGATVAGYVLVAFALVAALLNASIGLCLGCEMFLALRRVAPARAA